MNASLNKISEKGRVPVLRRRRRYGSRATPDETGRARIATIVPLEDVRHGAANLGVLVDGLEAGSVIEVGTARKVDLAQQMAQ